MKGTKKYAAAGLALALTVLFCSAGAARITFTDENLGFSFEYPVDYRAEPLQGPTEVARFAMANEFKLPVLVANVRDRGAEQKLDSVPAQYADRLRSAVPGASKFRLVGQKRITLADGNAAVYFRVAWTWIDGTTPMETIAVAAFKSGKTIMLAATILPDRKTAKEVSELCRTLNTTL